MEEIEKHGEKMSEEPGKSVELVDTAYRHCYNGSVRIVYTKYKFRTNRSEG